MGVFTRDDLQGGMQRLGCDDILKLRAKVEELRGALHDREACKEEYAFTFQFALDQHRVLEVVVEEPLCPSRHVDRLR